MWWMSECLTKPFRVRSTHHRHLTPSRILTPWGPEHDGGVRLLALPGDHELLVLPWTEAPHGQDRPRRVTRRTSSSHADFLEVWRHVAYDFAALKAENFAHLLSALGRRGSFERTPLFTCQAPCVCPKRRWKKKLIKSGMIMRMRQPNYARYII